MCAPIPAAMRPRDGQGVDMTKKEFRFWGAIGLAAVAIDSGAWQAVGIAAAWLAMLDIVASVNRAES